MKYIEFKIYPGLDNLDKLIDEINIVGFPNFEIFDPRDFEDFKEESDSLEYNYVSSEILELKDEEPYLSFYFEENKDIPKELLDISKEYRVTKRISDDKDWLNNWKEYFKPTHYGKNIVIKPSWEEYERKDEEIVVDIDPGEAFGTGSSPTTSLVISLIEKYIHKGDDVLDVGCGTGILSIVAAKMGANKILALDLDEKAVESTKTNIKLNNLDNEIEVKKNDLVKEIYFKADVTTANLMFDIIEKLIDDIDKNLKEKGIIIFSGIIKDREVEAINLFKRNGYEIVEIMRLEEWVSIVVRRPTMICQDKN